MKRGIEVRGSPEWLRIPARWGRDLLVEARDGSIASCTFVARRRAGPREPADALLAAAAEQVQAYFERRLRRFDLPLGFEGTGFQRLVWEAVAALAFGEFVSYADVARAIGKPLAHRGVAATMRATPIALFVPAHRVVGSDGRVRGAGPGSIRYRLAAFERQ